jgi:hypothetical protein
MIILVEDEESGATAREAIAKRLEEASSPRGKARATYLFEELKLCGQ